MSTMKCKRRPQPGVDPDGQGPPQEVVDRLAGLLPERALEDAADRSRAGADQPPARPRRLDAAELLYGGEYRDAFVREADGVWRLADRLMMTGPTRRPEN
jgi:hypothetical protein